MNLPPTHPAAIAASDLGAVDLGGYAWQIKMPDPAAFLRAVAPVLESRIASGEFAAYTGTVELHLYTQGVSIRFESGKIAGITPGEPAEETEGSRVRIPPNLFAPLVLGQKTFAECAAFYPDLAAEKRTRRLLEVLFPRMNGFFHCPY